jgi:hypothetical protein
LRGADDEMGNSTDTVVLRLLWLDEHGAEQHTKMTTSMKVDALRARSAEMRQALILYHMAMGWQLLDVQVEVPDRRGLIDRRRRARPGGEDRRSANDSVSSEDTGLVPLFPPEEKAQPRRLARVLEPIFGRKKS